MDERQSLLQMLKQKSQGGNAGNSFDIQIFDVMMEKYAQYKERIDQEYRDKIQSERERADRYKIEMDAANKLQNATKEQLDEVKNRVSQLEIDLRNERDISRMLKMSEDKPEKPDAEDLQEQQHRKDMMKQIKELTGQVASLQKKLAEAPRQKIVQSKASVPSFEFKPVHDSNGRIVSVTATPIGG